MVSVTERVFSPLQPRNAGGGVAGVSRARFPPGPHLRSSRFSRFPPLRLPPTRRLFRTTKNSWPCHPKQEHWLLAPLDFLRVFVLVVTSEDSASRVTSITHWHVLASGVVIVLANYPPTLGGVLDGFSNGDFFSPLRPRNAAGMGGGRGGGHVRFPLDPHLHSGPAPSCWGPGPQAFEGPWRWTQPNPS